MRHSYGSKQARAQKTKHALERKVLAHLKRYGASLYDALYIRFDLSPTAAIKTVLHSLKEYGYIEVTRDKMVTITAVGLQHLEGKD